ncbi:MAG: response regulator transcription factor [Chloroflexi bacterium]|nr:response regulator transcription factor [Chloroflexota bacterium]
MTDFTAEPISVLVVDDNPTFLQATTAFVRRQPTLSLAGVARGGAEALAQTRRLAPQVVLVDLDMPDRSGLQTIARVRDAAPGVGIIALTLLDAQTCREAALAAGANDLLSKTALTANLMPAIWRIRTRLNP